MYWALFAYFVIPVGAVLTLMLVSGAQWLVTLATRLLSTPLRIHSVTISLDLMMTGFCSILGMLAYSSMRRAEFRLAQSKTESLAAMRANVDELMRNVAVHDRNFWLSILGLTLWGVAWRLKTLFVSQAIAVQPRKDCRSMSSRLKWAAFALVCLALADVPLCRLNYTVQLISFVSPQKASMLEFGKSHGCRDVMLAGATGECAKFCTEARNLADDRLWAVTWARNWHISGKYAAQVFDGFRGVQQGQDRIAGLFAKKTCEGVLKSVDKSNHLVNTACGLFACISIIGCFIGMQNALSAGEGNRRPTVGNKVAILGTANTQANLATEIGKQHTVSHEASAYRVIGHTVRLFEEDLKLVEEISSTPRASVPAASANGPAVGVPAKESNDMSPSATALFAAPRPPTATVKATAKKDNVMD